MTSVFVRLVNISLTASWIILAVVLLRLLLKKVPKWISVLLWGIVAVRLLIPVHIHSHLSLLPSAEVIPQNFVTSQTPVIYSGIPAVSYMINSALEEQFAQGGGMERMVEYAAIVWLVGMALLFLYSLITTLRLRYQVRASLKLRDNAYICDDVAFPFVLGVINPRIYLPSGIDEEAVPHVLAHENAHIKRKDHWWKPLGFVLLSVYWFNPLMWLAYVLLSRDIEQACDEKVVAGMDIAGKKHYSEALAECSTQRRMILVCPVAFGEVDIKSRINGVLHYKKPAFWIIMAAVAACAVVAVCFLTDPFPCAHHYEGTVTVEATCTTKGKESYTCTKCAHCYVKTVSIHDHTFDEGVVLEAPTCVSEGLKESTCTGCGKKNTTVLRVTPHIATEVTVLKAPNCVDTGEGTSVCAFCERTYTLQLPANEDHALQETVTKEATCTQIGEGVISCQRCSYEQKCVYEKKEHEHVLWSFERATCEREGTQIFQCKSCGEVTTVTSPKLESHTWENLDGGIKRCIFCAATKVTYPEYQNGKLPGLPTLPSLPKLP